MTRLQLEFGARTFTADIGAGRDISIALNFDGPQPNHFGAIRASAEPMRAGDFVGDTRAGGSCNASVLRMNPHCNGTHTECIGHVTTARQDILAAAPPCLLPAALVSVRPESVSDSSEGSRPPPLEGDKLITARALGQAMNKLPGGEYPALIVRTLPNARGKRTREYTQSNSHPYYSLAAIEMLVACGVQHLLVDTPSVDRFDDQGELAGHRKFWGLEPGAVEAGAASRSAATITEMIFVDDDLADGIYLMNLQIAPFVSDATPSRPVLFKASVA